MVPVWAQQKCLKIHHAVDRYEQLNFATLILILHHDVGAQVSTPGLSFGWSVLMFLEVAGLGDTCHTLALHPFSYLNSLSLVFSGVGGTKGNDCPGLSRMV